MTQKTPAVLLNVLFLVLCVVAGGRLIIQKFIYEEFERAGVSTLHDVKKEFNNYYARNGFVYPTDISELESWKSTRESVRDECEFVGNKNVYLLRDGKLFKIYLRTFVPRKSHWFFGEATVTVLVESPYGGNGTYDFQHKRRTHYLALCDVPPDSMIELETPLPETIFVRQLLGKDPSDVE